MEVMEEICQCIFKFPTPSRDPYMHAMRRSAAPAPRSTVTFWRATCTFQRRRQGESN